VGLGEAIEFSVVFTVGLAAMNRREPSVSVVFARVVGGLWMTVEATITETDVVTQGSVSGQTGGEVHYEPRIAFTYEYRGESYTGTNVFPAHIAPEYDQRSKTESVISEYETGTTVTAYVDPNDPGDAFLKNTPSDTPLIAAGIGATISLFGGVSVWKQYRDD
jgi:hypothetical protein